MTMVCVETSCSQMFSSWLTGFFGRDGSSQLVAYVMYPTVDGMVWSCSIEKHATTCALWVWIRGFQPINRVSHLSWWLLVDVLFAPGAAMWWYRAHFQAKSLENLGPSKNFDLHPGRLTWNLRIHPWKRKIIWTKPSFSGSIFIFGGVEKDCKLRVQWFVTLLHLPQKPVWDERWRCTQSLFVGRKLV